MRSMKTMLLSLVLMLAFLAASAFGADKDVVIDVRTEAEWSAGHLEGALSIPYERIAEGITTVASDKGTRIYLYCRTGRRSGLAFDVLRKSGYEDVINLGTMENAAKELGRHIVK